MRRRSSRSGRTRSLRRHPSSRAPRRARGVDRAGIRLRRPGPGGDGLGDQDGHGEERRPRRPVPGRDALGRRWRLPAARRRVRRLGPDPHLRWRHRDPVPVRPHADQGPDRARGPGQPAAGDRLPDRPRRPGWAGLPDPGRLQLERAEAATFGRHHCRARPVAVPPVGAALRGRLVPLARGPDRGGRPLAEGRSSVIRLPLVLFFSAALFSTGVYGVLARRNAVLVLMSIELMLNAVNVNLVAFSQFWHDVTGQVFALFVIAVAAAEVGIGPGFTRLAWVVAVLPLVSAALTLFFGKRTPGRGWFYGVTAVGAGFVLSVLVLWHFVQGGGATSSSVSWFAIGPLHVEAGQFVDGLTAIMLIVVTGISLAVHVYSIGYMHGDVRFTWFYVVLSVFTAAMLDVVIADNLIQLLVGWEVMGLCSYLLIGHWWEERINSNAAIKAFITTRIGDVPFMFGIFALIAATGFHSANIQRVGELVGGADVSRGLVSVAALLLFGGTIGKSAQFPLHVWLPDAMQGPTPVSALIHAATMVAAGVYLVGRLYSVFLHAAPEVLRFVGVIGGIT